jgi:lipopolysaccharide transport system permease protein
VSSSKREKTSEIDVRNTKTRLFLLRELIRRDLTSRYAGSSGGALWSLLNPLILCLLYSFVFAVVLRIPTPSGYAGGYTEFLLAGYLPWIGFQEAFSRGTTSISDHAHLVKKLQFPIELLVLSSLVSALILQLLSLFLFTGFLGIRGHASIHPLPLAGAFVLETLLLFGPALAFAALNVYFRDIAQLLSPLLMIALYLSPILYPETMVPKALAWALEFNPIRELVALFRAGLLGAPAPPFARLGMWAAVFLVVAYGGVWFFRRCKPSFADLL